MSAMSIFTDPTKRAWLYRVAFGVIGLAGVYGIVDEQEAAGWIAFATAMAGTGLAIGNTSTKTSPPPPE